MLIIYDGILTFDWDKNGDPKAWVDLKVLGTRLVTILIIILTVIGLFKWAGAVHARDQRIFGDQAITATK